MANIKLTEENKAEIRRLSSEEGYTQAALAAKFNVSQMTIHRVLNPDYYARTLKQSKEYQRENVKRIGKRRSNTYRSYNLSFRLDRDAAVIERLDKEDNIHDYIRNLVTDDIKKDTPSNDN